MNSYAKGLLFRRLSKLSGLQIDNNSIEIVSIKPSNSKAGNTEVVLRARSQSFFKGTKVYYYNRSPLQTTSEPLTIEIGERKVAWVWELLELIYVNTGVKHLTEEIVNARITQANDIDVMFTDSHPLWLGGFKVRLVNQKPTESVRLNALTTPAKLANALYDTVDFTALKDALFRFKVGQSNLNVLDSILNTKGELRWVYDVSYLPRNLYGATVVYNGPSHKLPLAKRKTGHLLRVRLSSEHCSDYYGELNIYY